MQTYHWLSGAIFLLFALVVNTYAQGVIPASGGALDGNTGSGSYTVGGSVFGTHSSTSGSISSGVQQPYEISVITGLDNMEGVKVTAYPNPVSEYLMITAEGATYLPISFQFYNTNGEILKAGIVDKIQTMISMEDLEPSTYILQLIDDQQATRSYKIVKH